jgi:membrane-associated phospholipid phosphatase
VTSFPSRHGRLPCLIAAAPGYARPMPGADPPTRRVQGWRHEVEALDVAVYAAVSASPTPSLDRGFAALSRSADHGVLWIAAAAVIAITGGRSGRRAAVDGLASLAVTSAIVNLGLKPIRRRRRPDRAAHAVPISRHVEMPRTTSFPSGHAASGFAFAAGVADELPALGIPFHGAAALVAYSRVHTGVHYPIDVVVGSLVGGALAPLTNAALDRRRGRAG